MNPVSALPSTLGPGFCWHTHPHDHDPFHLNPHRKAHTLYYLATPIACVEPSGRGLVVRFLAHHFETPERPVAVVSVRRGKCFIQNWLCPRQQAVVAGCHRQALSPQSPHAGAQDSR